MTKEKSCGLKKGISLECLMACLYFVFLPFTVVTTPFGSLLKVVTIPIICVLTLRMLMGKSDLSFNYIHFLYAVYVIYTIGTLFLCADEMAVVTVKDMVLGLFMLILISLRVYNKQEIELIETAWIAMGVYCIIAGLTSKEVVSEYESRAVIRILGFEEDQNQFCAYLIMPVLISIKRFTEKRRFYPLYAAIIAASFYVILKTGSRGGLIGVLFGVVAYIVIGIKNIRTKIIVIALSVLTVIVFVTVVMPMLPEDVAMRFSVEAVEKDGGSGRFDIWKYLIEYSAREPMRLIRGSGIFSTYDIMHAAGFKNGVAHNAFIQILNDEGIIGLLIFTAAIGACVLRNIKNKPVYAAAVIALLAFSMSLTFYVFKPYLNVMMMCAISVYGELPEDSLILCRKYKTEEQGLC